MSHYKRTAKSSKKNNDKKTKVKYSVKIADNYRNPPRVLKQYGYAIRQAQEKSSEIFRISHLYFALLSIANKVKIYKILHDTFL